MSPTTVFLGSIVASFVLFYHDQVDADLEIVGVNALSKTWLRLRTRNFKFLTRYRRDESDVRVTSS